MRRFSTSILFGALLACTSIAQANVNLVVNGDFSTPAQGSGWSAVPNGGVAGWTNTLNNDGIEINSPGSIGGSAYPGTTQSAELNGTTWDTISQTVTGLTIGESYTLSWAYGERPGSGFQQTAVSFGDALITTDTSSGLAETLTWSFNSFDLIATDTTENLVFAALNQSETPGSNSSVGNEITAVSLTDVPEPMSTALIGLGLVALVAVRRKFNQ